MGGLASPQAVQAAGSGSTRTTAQPTQSSPQANTAAAQKAKANRSQRARIVRIAKSHLGAQYKFGAEGAHNRFDCSGLVYAVYKQAGLLNKIGGARRGARGYYRWFKRRGLASRNDPNPGDLVIWHKGKHIGIYIANDRIISAVNRKYDVRVHGLNFVSGFTAYLHVQLRGQVPPTDGGTPGATPTVVESTVDHLIVRAGPGKVNDRIAIVHRGTTVTVTDKARDAKGRKWYEGTLPSGKLGWLPAWHVTVV
jgi:cell wall-associated NlpC family hydrolase